ncbi:Putative ribonuclease H protein [Dendrobium catenatum]|uniref:Ribonuclease H protein n=1 Tax=Dendrobium catenatum TaxID=906689 RepID=A0A2I0X6J4_9ASPA|nr:Putative ribonuclease H protein [Dendrobium catenatum]
MECVKDARFSFIINGKASRWITAANGFRQGCPFSPYLYILCSQLFSLAMAQDGQDLGIQISKRSQNISHLLYADDVLIFSHATKNLANKLRSIVTNFCNWTSLKVNNAKSQIIFSKSMERTEKSQVNRILNFRTVNELQYLGVQLLLRKPMRADFQFLIDNVLHKLNSWGGKCLSLAGKLLLVKASLLSLPNFSSTHNMVPKKVLLEIDKCCRDFIWNKRNGKKEIHYVAWNTLCKSTDKGGRNLHSVVDRAGPLKARLTWRMIQEPESLLSRVVTTKNGNDVWNIKNKRNTSVAGKVLTEGARYLKPLLRWRIANGRSIDVVNDVWLLDKSFSEWPIMADCLGL